MRFQQYMRRQQGDNAAVVAAALIADNLSGLSEWAKLAYVHQVLPFVSVDAERSFSTLQFVQEQLRNQLGEGASTLLDMAVRGARCAEEWTISSCWLSVRGRRRGV